MSVQYYKCMSVGDRQDFLPLQLPRTCLQIMINYIERKGPPEDTNENEKVSRPITSQLTFKEAKTLKPIKRVDS